MPTGPSGTDADPSPGNTTLPVTKIRTDQHNIIKDILDGVSDVNFAIPKWPTITKTSNYTILHDDIVLLGDTSSGEVTLTLPGAALAGNKRKVYVIKKIHVSNNLIIEGNASETIDGSLNITLSNLDETVILVSDETNWRVLASHNSTHTHVAADVTNFNAAVQTSRLDEMAAPTSDVSANSNKITNLTDGVSNQDAVSVKQLNDKIDGLKHKEPVRAASTANGTLATDFENTDTLDGVTLATGDRILLKDQSTGSENGIYVVQASGVPVRATDFDLGSEVDNAAILVDEGTANGEKRYTLTNDGTITIGSTALTFVRFSGLDDLSADTGVQIVSNVIKMNIPGLGDETALQLVDSLAVYDSTGGVHVESTIGNILKVLKDKTVITDLDDTADKVAVIDDSDSEVKLIDIDDFFKGIHDIWIPAGAIYANATDPPTALAIEEATTNKQNIAKFAFPDAAKGKISFLWKLPREWDLSTFTFSYIWKTPAATLNVRFTLRAISYENGEAFDHASWGTAVELIDTAITAAEDILESGVSGNVTVGNTPSATRRLVLFEIERDPAHASDTLANTADLLGIELHIGTNKKASA